MGRSENIFFSSRHYHLILYKAWADLRSEARKFYLSYLWWILEPLFEMFIYYLVFAVLLNRGTPNFVQFLLIGLVAWEWFGTTVMHCGGSILGAKGLIQQASIPKFVFPTAAAVNDTFKAAIAMIMVEIFLLSSGFFPNIAYL